MTLRALALLVTMGLVVGCVTIRRTPFTQADRAVAIIPAIPAARFWADTPDLATRMAPGDPTGAVLELSSGGDDGAYAAGVLAGWTEAGQRPDFAVVTGVSTGALIAPLALLGPQADATIAHVYTHLGPGDVYRLRFPLAILSSSSAATADRLGAIITDVVTDRVIDAVAVEQRAGRRLFVQTTDLDAKRGVVWDMGAIATSTAPGRYALFPQVLLASAALPGFLPPVAIDTATPTRTITEMHVDGGVTSQLLDPPLPGRHPVYVIASSRLGGDFAMTSAHTLPIARRAYGFDLQSALRIQIGSIWRRVAAAGGRFRVSFICNDLAEPDHQLFDTGYMRGVFAYGVQHGRAGRWLDHPPTADELD